MARDPEKQRAYDREYKRRKRRDDPEWREQANARDSERHRQQWREDPEFREKSNEARRRRRAEPGYLRREWLRTAHGMYPEDWQRMFDGQDGRCCYCRRPLQADAPKAVVVDHDHSCCPPNKSCTRCRRGLACQDCNKVIALAYEDSERLEIIAANLRVLAAAARERINGETVRGELPFGVTPIRREAAG